MENQILRWVRFMNFFDQRLCLAEKCIFNNFKISEEDLSKIENCISQPNEASDQKIS